jgi:hypothetical protein
MKTLAIFFSLSLGLAWVLGDGRKLGKKKNLHVRDAKCMRRDKQWLFWNVDGWNVYRW